MYKNGKLDNNTFKRIVKKAVHIHTRYAQVYIHILYASYSYQSKAGQVGGGEGGRQYQQGPQYIPICI